MTNRQILNPLKRFAKLYDDELAGNDLMYIYKSKNGIEQITVSFNSENFLHLMGLKPVSNHSSNYLYSLAVSGNVSATDFYQINPRLTAEKIKALKTNIKTYKNAKVFGERNATYGIKNDFIFACGDNTAFLGFKFDSNRIYGLIPLTNIYDNIKNAVIVECPIYAIARKSHNDIQFSEITYISDDYKIPFPKEIQDKLTIETNSEIQRVSDDRNITFDDFHIERLRGTQTMSIELDSQKGGGKHFYSINLYSEIDRISSDFAISNELATTLFEKGREFSLLDESIYKRSLTEIAEELTPELPIEIKPPSPDVDEFDMC
jgi:hypothetical protein